MPKVTQTSRGPCRATKPTHCPYHGAVLRMEAAKRAGDFETFFEERTIVETLEKDGFNGREFQELLAQGKVTEGDNAVQDEPAVTTPAPAGKAAILDAVITTDRGSFLQVEALVDPKETAEHEPQDYYYDREDDTVYAKAGTRQPENHLPDSLRIQVARDLKDGEAEHLAQLLGYRYAVAVRGERLPDPEKESSRSIVLYADFTKSRRDDLGDGFNDLEDGLGDFFVEGSPQRKTKQNTRLIEGVSEDLKPELYYGYGGVGYQTQNTRAPLNVPEKVLKLWN